MGIALGLIVLIWVLWEGLFFLALGTRDLARPVPTRRLVAVFVLTAPILVLLWGGTLAVAEYLLGVPDALDQLVVLIPFLGLGLALWPLLGKHRRYDILRHLSWILMVTGGCAFVLPVAALCVDPPDCAHHGGIGLLILVAVGILGLLLAAVPAVAVHVLRPRYDRERRELAGEIAG
jgi:hypothetical protein